MSKLAHKDKPWQGPITWEPLSNLPDFIQTVDNAVMNTQEHASLIAQAVDNAHLFADFPVLTMMETLKDQRDIVSVYRRQIEQWRKGPLSMEQHFEITYFEGQCVRLDSLLSLAIDQLEVLKKTATSSGRSRSKSR